MRTIKKITLKLLLLFSFCIIYSNAKCVTITFANNPQYVCTDASSFTASGGNTSVMQGNVGYLLSFSYSTTSATGVTTSGGNYYTNVCLYVDGVPWSPTQGRIFNTTTTHSIAIWGAINLNQGYPSVGSSENITFNITNTIGQLIATYTMKLICVAQAIQGPTSLCINGSGTYSVSHLISTDAITWKSSNSLWHFQNGSSTYTGTLASVTLTAPSTAVSTTITATGLGICDSQAMTITMSSTIPANPGVIVWKNDGSDCEYEVYVPAVTGATSYVWTGTVNGRNYSVETQDPIFGYWNPLSKIVLSVKAKNACGQSTTASSRTFTLPAAPSGCTAAPHPNNRLSDDANANNIAISNTTEIYPNPASQSVNVKFEASKDDNYNINIFDMMGRRVYASNNYFAEGSHEVNIDLKDLSNGIYYVVAGSSDNRTSNKLIIAH